jgi:hypothetical protein
MEKSCGEKRKESSELCLLAVPAVPSTAPGYNMEKSPKLVFPNVPQRREGRV